MEGDVVAIGSSSRGGAKVRLIAIHTAEGARKASDLEAYFNRSGVNASSHAIVDANNTLQILSYDRASWTLRSGNPISDNLEICAFAKWTRAQWMSTGTVDGCANPKAMLARTAKWIRSRCLARDIPIRRLTHAQIRAGAAGVIAHDDWTKAMQDGSHWDPGPNFPWDYVLDLARGEPTKEWDEMATRAEIRAEMDAALKSALAVVKQTEDGGTSTVKALLPWIHKHVVDTKNIVQLLADDEAKLTAVINAAVSSAGSGDPEVIKAKFIEALREVLRVEEAEETP
jgi:hypothetical protein